MAMVAHDPAAAKRLGIPQSVGKEFTKADVGRKFKTGGLMATKKETMGPRTMSKDVEKGSNKLGSHGESKIQKKGHTKAMMPKMAGTTTGLKKGGLSNTLKKGGIKK
jgi:hypothetical protein